MLDGTVKEYHARYNRHDLPAYGFASQCCKLGGVSSQGWLGGGDALLDPRFQTIFGLLDKASKLDGGVERSACCVTWHIMRECHVVKDKEIFCMLQHTVQETYEGKRNSDYLYE